MAYTFFPKQQSEIKKELSDFPEDNLKEIETLFAILRNKSKTPINIDPAKKSNVNISRELSDEISLADIKKKANLNKIKIKYGNGSSGNRGANNRGNLFEPQFADALLKWWAGEDVGNDAIMSSIKYLDKVYDISNSKKFKVNVVGGENTRRPLKFGSKIELTNPKGAGFDVGESVRDNTLELDKKDIYLSLKLGGTTTFFNVGIKTILTTAEIKKGNITNSNGLKLLGLFGINPAQFCNIFNKPGKGFIDKNPKFNKIALQNLLQSGIGFGYCIVHKKGGKIHTKKMDKKDMIRAATITGKPTIYYGGKGGKGKRVDVEFESSAYKFKINIRDTQGKDGYPTRMMCDFTDKK